MDNNTNTASTTEQQRNNSEVLLLSLEDNKYANLDESQLEEFAKIASPKVSDLLHEQALVLDDLLDTSAWNSDSSSHSSYSSKKRRRRKKKKDNHDGNEDDSMNDEWNQLEQNQSSLQDELNAVTLHDFYTTDDRYTDNNDGNDDWNNSIHQYYTANNKQSTGELSSNTGQSSASASTATTNYLASPQQQSNKWTSNPNNINHPYTLADHAKTLDITRSESNGRLYTKPLLSRYDIQTLNILSIPESIKHPSSMSSSTDEVTCISSSNRERYIQTIVNCNIEYIEPIKSKYLKRLFSGWQPGPGENREVHQQQQEERITQQQGGDDSSQRVMAYTPPKSANQSSLDNDNNDEVSSEEEENADNFEDINGMTYESSNKSSLLEPLPVRTVTIRIRCDVMCGAVMDALTTSVEGLGGEMTKRQGGHLRAVIPGRKLSVFALGTRERAREILDEINAVVGGESSSPQRGGDSKDSDEEESSHDNFEVVNSQFDPTTDLPTTSPRHYDDDSSSVASGFSTLLSPILGTPNSHSKRNQGRTCEVLPPFIVDAQIVTKKVGRECQRLLLIRIFRVQDVARAQVGMGEDEESEAFDMITPLDLDTKGEKVTGISRKQNDSGAKVKATNPLMESKKSLQGLIEASALVQRIKAVGGNGFAINPQPTGGDDEASVSSYASTKSYLKSFTDTVTSPIRYFGGTTSYDSPIQEQQQQQSSPTTSPSVMELMTKYILRKLIPSPSVGSLELAKAKQKSKGIYPALSREDQQYIKSSWMFLKNMIEELDQRCLAYSTLGHSPLFKSPALPSLDVHFIAQVKAFCRESMIISLVKTASDLEIFARESELSCGNVDQLLRPTFDMYKLVPPQLPNPVPLTAYPLEFEPPEETSPPWGSEVMSALEKISNDTNTDQAQAKDPLTSITLSEKAVSSIVQAFQKQNDIEQGARLGRKNLQVMDRLAKMQAHRQACIAKIRGSYGKNLLATEAADDLHTLRKKSSNVGVGSQTDEIHSASDEVPLLICNVLVGNSAGTCYVTHSHILFQTQLLPLLGGSKVHLFSLMDVEVTINAPTKSVLSPLPSSISFTTAILGGRKSTREEVYNFIPSIGARRFAKFLEVLRDNA